MNSIADFFCEGRPTPLLIGSVKSNMGHSEPASGLSSLAKLLVAMEAGVIPGNLHYSTPNAEIPALTDGRLQVTISPQSAVIICLTFSYLSTPNCICLMFNSFTAKAECKSACEERRLQVQLMDRRAPAFVVY